MHHTSVLAVQNGFHEVKTSQAGAVSQLSEILGERDQDGGDVGGGRVG